ncbi:hypothetical protein P9847_11455 [Paenibacillus chibensis]|uniref:Uncharacterized protein n=1 Tax=Paenibacillus chibensis TaxID=59846 RepID=A0ABU6PSR6_9BACL|nr:hypothetical protein [Paenibacillus chibensis]
MNRTGYQKKYIIAAGSLSEAEQIAKDNGLLKKEWTYAYCGYPTKHLKDGLQAESEEMLLGDFKTEERWLLTAHLEKGRIDHV